MMTTKQCEQRSKTFQVELLLFSFNENTQYFTKKSWIESTKYCHMIFQNFFRHEG